LLHTGNRDKKATRLIVRDDANGIPASFDGRNTCMLGFHLVNSLTDQLSGTIDRDRSSGTKFTIVIPEQGPASPGCT